jgi:hypothetical protein
MECRIGPPDGSVKRLLSIGRAGITESGDLEYIGRVTASLSASEEKRKPAKASGDTGR